MNAVAQAAEAGCLDGGVAARLAAAALGCSAGIAGQRHGSASLAAGSVLDATRQFAGVAEQDAEPGRWSLAAASRTEPGCKAPAVANLKAGAA